MKEPAASRYDLSPLRPSPGWPTAAGRLLLCAAATGRLVTSSEQPSLASAWSPRRTLSCCATASIVPVLSKGCLIICAPFLWYYPSVVTESGKP
eukprot:2354792-Rhodomonas_salina.2